MRVGVWDGSTQTRKLLLYLYWKGKGTLHQGRKHLRRRMAPQVEAEILVSQDRKMV